MAVSKDVQTMFFLLYVGYFVNNYLRMSVSFASPVIMKEENLRNSDIGLILSSQMTGYMVVKFMGGTMVDKVDPALIFSVSLVLGGMAGAAFIGCSSVAWFALFWFLCGMAQGPAWSACGVLLKKNFPSDQLATWWSLASTSINVAGSVGPFLSAVIVANQGWRMSIIMGSTINIGLGFICFTMLKSTPPAPESDGDKQQKSASGSMKDLFTPVPILIYLIYLLVTVVRGVFNDWGQHYLIQIKGQPIDIGSSFNSSQEVGGIVGSLVMGFLSDILVSRQPGRSTPRVAIVTALTVIQTMALYLFIFHVSAASSQFWISFLSFCVGFCMYSCIALLGICSMEVTPDNLAGTAHSMAALGGNIGRILAGYPLSLVATCWSWHESFCIALMVSGLCVAVCLACFRMLTLRYARQDKEKLL